MLLEFDESKSAIINPQDIISKIDGFPEVVVSCFSKVTFDHMLHAFSYKEIAKITFANLTIPVYEIEYEGVNIGLFNAYVGAAGCCAAVEELIALGMKKLIMFGTCGVLDKAIDETTIIIPTHALRDEGTSYHYIAPSDEIELNQTHIEPFKSLLNHSSIPYVEGKVWTTDAFYRETKEKLERRKVNGCVCVDMECSAVAAVCQFRNIEHLHFFYSADNLDSDSWDSRSLSNQKDIKKKHNIALVALAYGKLISNDIDINE